ncbi:nucleoside-diphosphate sugar epimerase/dehydratase, partial [Sporofaciens musculi]|uniref:nucleoside-diphosphate sugar epimerase/dehydratase n=1 Tax=Sporofaciens musculi TaxID=2681861 RepID=UPI00259D231F
MYEYEWKLVKKTVQKYVETKQGHGSLHTPVYVFGVSERTYHIIRELSWKGIKVKGVLDNDRKKQGMHCCGIPVVSVNAIEKEGKSRVDVFIMSPFWREMEKQLMETGLQKRHIYVIKAIKRIQTVFVMRSLHVHMGKAVYGAIRKKYGINAKIFLCPYTGTGDIYLIGTFLQQYIRQKQIENYVLVVVSTACKKVADLFDIKNIEQLPSTDVCSRLISYYMAEPEQCDMEILNDSWGEIYTNPTQWIRGYKGHNFTEMFRKYVFRLSDDTMPQPPTLKNADDQIDRIFTGHGLVRGKTVILSPYAMTLANLPNHFWEELVVALQKKGYSV